MRYNNEKTILLAEDERSISRALELKLTGVGLGVQIVTDGEEALKVLEKTDFDLVLLDLVLPKLDGFAVLAWIKEKGKTAPVVVLSNLGQPEDVVRAKDLGAKEYFIKSNTTLADIVKYVSELLKYGGRKTRKNPG